jgi:hypothetical protein
MGKRREPRKDIKVPVRIFGTDSSGQIFSEKVFTANVSRHGAELVDVQAQLNKEEIVGLTYGQTKGHFRVKWVGQTGTAKAGHVGLLNLSPEKALWDFPLPQAGVDDTPVSQEAHERRQFPRFKSTNSIEIYPIGQTVPIRARTTDISMGGCFIEMSNPVAKGTQIRVSLWLKDVKVWANCRVVTSTPGFGIGVQFTEMSDLEKNQLKQFVDGLRQPIRARPFV